MSHINAKELIKKAYDNGYAIPAFNTQGGHYDISRAIVETAAEEKAPVILMAYEANLEYTGYDGFSAIGRHLVDKYSATVILHLDHASCMANLRAAAEAGFDSLMIDYSKKPLEENISITCQALELAEQYSVAVEAELGELQRNDGVASIKSQNLVDPKDVAVFLGRAKPDMLAIGIGNAHGFYKGEPNIRIDLLEKVRDTAKGIPLVLHGTTGIPDQIVKDCISRGIAKVNFGTLIRFKYLEYFTAGLNGAVDHNNHTWKISKYAMETLKNDIRSIIHLTGAAGRVE
jgi:ketose-bisphosphate aldolase